ncbi:MAG TPA: 4Fe-4S dicluster domain-containing protein [Deltaproteobacteria bacterium]|jgi:formate dehydrogenase iron-sulfur subunit|nr:4Fe-4S dicluster domain-containing protein [Deltaproteobacteria bacterium]HOI06103.1 4Fe-4S dicluster domain-containing protein [Deltaproteobacteria bacterium]
MKEYAILLDTTYCTGCNSCAYRCVQEFRYHDKAAKGLFRTFVQVNDDGLYQKRCMHCLEPDCVANCPVEALTKSASGQVLYDAAKCIGCKTCVKSCKFGIPQYDADTKKIVKCSMCAHRAGENKEPACVEICPTGALQFGEYREILAKAKALAAKGKLKIYGMNENGGTHLFVLAKVDPVKFGYPKVAAKTIKAGVSMNDLSLPTAIAAMAIGGLRKLDERKAQVAAAEEKGMETKE